MFQYLLTWSLSAVSHASSEAGLISTTPQSGSRPSGGRGGAGFKPAPTGPLRGGVESEVGEQAVGGPGRAGFKPAPTGPLPGRVEPEVGAQAVGGPGRAGFKPAPTGSFAWRSRRGPLRGGVEPEVGVSGAEVGKLAYAADPGLEGGANCGEEVVEGGVVGELGGCAAGCADGAEVGQVGLDGGCEFG